MEWRVSQPKQLPKYIIFSLLLWLIAGFALGALLFGCASNYERALAGYNSMMEQYKPQYEAASPATQEKLRTDIHPEMITVGEALQSWSKAQDDEQAQVAYQEMYNLLIQSLLRHGVIIVEGDTNVK